MTLLSCSNNQPYTDGSHQVEAHSTRQMPEARTAGAWLCAVRVLVRRLLVVLHCRSEGVLTFMSATSPVGLPGAA